MKRDLARPRRALATVGVLSYQRLSLDRGGGEEYIGKRAVVRDDGALFLVDPFARPFGALLLSGLQPGCVRACAPSAEMLLLRRAPSHHQRSPSSFTPPPFPFLFPIYIYVYSSFSRIYTLALRDRSFFTRCASVEARS